MPSHIRSVWKTLSTFFQTEGGFEGKIIATPTNPATNRVRIYPKADGWYSLDHNGNEVMIGTGVPGGQSSGNSYMPGGW